MYLVKLSNIAQIGTNAMEKAACFSLSVCRKEKKSSVRKIKRGSLHIYDETLKRGTERGAAIVFTTTNAGELGKVLFNMTPVK